MRTLTMDEMDFVVGGDDAVDGNRVACQTAVGAATVAIGIAAGGQVGAAVGAVGPAAVAVCQTATTAAGSAVGGGAADAADSIAQTNQDLSYAASSYLMIKKMMTGGL